jgi:hypothetical protein
MFASLLQFEPERLRVQIVARILIKVSEQLTVAPFFFE